MLSSNERVKNAKKRALTDFNAPNGSRDILFQSQEFEQDGRRHFAGFRPHFHLTLIYMGGGGRFTPKAVFCYSSKTVGTGLLKLCDCYC